MCFSTKNVISRNFTSEIKYIKWKQLYLGEIRHMKWGQTGTNNNMVPKMVKNGPKRAYFHIFWQTTNFRSTYLSTKGFTNMIKVFYLFIIYIKWAKTTKKCSKSSNFKNHEKRNCPSSNAQCHVPHMYVGTYMHMPFQRVWR